MNNTTLVTDYIKGHDWRIKENSNMQYSVQGLNVHLSGAAISNYWLNELLPSKCAEAHMDAALHMHDLSSLAAYCSGWNFLDILLHGLGGVAGKIESGPPKHLSTALGQLVNFLYTIQGETAGAVAVSNWDTLLAPFVRYDKLNYTQVKQLVQEFVFNCNIPTRTGFQTPFTNISLDIAPFAKLAEKHVVIGGQEQSEMYYGFQREMNMLNRAFAEAMLAGDNKGRPFSFPIPTYNLKTDRDIDLLPQQIWDMTAKYGIPYFGNYMNSDLNPDDFYSMCCRLRLDKRALRREGGFFSSAPLTGSAGVATINLPQIGYLARNEEEFFSRLTSVFAIAVNGLDARRKAVEHFTETGLYPYAKHYLRSVKDCTGSYWGNHFSTIGIIGAHEASLNLHGRGIDTATGKDFAIRVLEFLLAKIERLGSRSNGLYNLEATPCEGASYRLAKTDKRNHPDCITSGTDDAPHYTNSTHLPVGHDFSRRAFLHHQDDLQSLYTGGTVAHLFFEKSIEDPLKAKEIVRDTVHQHRIPYFTITPTFSICSEHGSTGGAHAVCSICSHDTEIWSRAVGYLRPVQDWNTGKQQEFSERNTFEG